MSERKCSAACRYFDAHTATSKIGDCRAKPAPQLRTVKFSNPDLRFSGVLSVSGGVEIKAGKPCLYHGPYFRNDEWRPPE